MHTRVLLTLNANGREIKGPATPAGEIECLEFREGSETRRHLAHHRVRRVCEPIEVVKRIDATSPLLSQALTCNMKLTAMFRFVHAEEEESFFTITITDGRLDAISRRCLAAQPSGTEAFLETLRIVFTNIEWSHDPSGASYKDSWAG